MRLIATLALATFLNFAGTAYPADEGSKASSVIVLSSYDTTLFGEHTLQAGVITIRPNNVDLITKWCGDAVSGTSDPAVHLHNLFRTLVGTRDSAEFEKWITGIKYITCQPEEFRIRIGASFPIDDTNVPGIIDKIASAITQNLNGTSL